MQTVQRYLWQWCYIRKTTTDSCRTAKRCVTTHAMSQASCLPLYMNRNHVSSVCSWVWHTLILHILSLYETVCAFWYSAMDFSLLLLSSFPKVKFLPWTYLQDRLTHIDERCIDRSGESVTGLVHTSAQSCLDFGVNCRNTTRGNTYQ